MDDDEIDSAWIEGVVQGIELLRSLGITSISAAGMRMGATIAAAAASSHDLGLASFVMWDPCESGRAYVRELGALGALRRNAHAVGLGEATKMLEYPVSDKAASQFGRFNLCEPSPGTLASRVLIVVRDDRTVSKEFRSCWGTERVEWATTSEQGPMMETELPASVQPASTIEQIRAWLTTPELSRSPFSTPPLSTETVVAHGLQVPVRESVVELGSRKMFGIVSERLDGATGPLIVMVNGINEDHVGPSRLWVELSRRWAGQGLRCVRFDFSELGESPWLPGVSTRPVFDKTLRYDIGDAVRALNPEDPSDSVLVGLCSGAQVALEAALDLKARGLYAINPQIGAGAIRSANSLRNSDREPVRSFARRFDKIVEKHHWFDDVVQRISRLVLLSAFSPKVKSALVKNNSEMLLLLGPNDLSPFRELPIVGTLVGRRLIESDRIQVEVIPGLDHDFLSTVGRARTLALLDRYVIERLAGAAD
jgi:pimeloyl-ACP methyl ester carboxylesterase